MIRQSDDEDSKLVVDSRDGRLFYLVSKDYYETREVSLLELWRAVWQGKWLILGTTSVFLALALMYVLLTTEWYRTEVLLVPTKEGSSQGLAGRLGNLGGLAGLAGIEIGDDDSVEAVAVLKSRDFSRSFIEGEVLVTVLLYEEWDESRKSWIEERAENQPDIRDAVDFFHEDVRRVIEDTRTGLITLRIDWIDPEVAASWATKMVERLNDRMRQRALSEAEENVEYLQAQLQSTNIATLRESIGSLLETEMQKLMLAKGAEEFAFRVVDSAQVPKEPVKPRGLLIVSLAIVTGAAMSGLFVLVRCAVGAGLSGRHS